MSDEAVRKEFEAVAEDILDSAYDMLISHGQRKAVIIAKLQDSRSAAIQECAAVVDSHQCRSRSEYVKTHLRDKVLALKER